MCRRMKPCALIISARLMIVLLSMDVSVRVPMESISVEIIELSLVRKIPQTSSWSSPLRTSWTVFAVALQSRTFVAFLLLFLSDY